MRRNVLIPGLVALIVTVLALFAYERIQGDSKANKVHIERLDSSESARVLYTRSEDGSFAPLDFTAVAEQVMDAVVHIKSTIRRSSQGGRGQGNPLEDFFNDDFFERFFGPQDPGNMPPQVGSGSGVIINSDGYIVTNNHVIRNAENIEVVLPDNRSFIAELVGTDPSTDIALIKIEANGLATIPFVSSDDVKVGEWVLAVGNPFNLTSTVTAGIVSAKARNINILSEQSQSAIESFIQTDAAINPGNSGGALVNLNGGLIGINTAIASPTGAYSGYGFAVPSDIVSKVVEDLLEYGRVQRGYLGVVVQNVTPELVAEQGLQVNDGAYVRGLTEGGSAEAAGIEVGDVIQEVNGVEINNNPELLGLIAKYRPGDDLFVVVDRKGNRREFTVELKNREGSTDVVSIDDIGILEKLGIEVAEIDEDVAIQLNIPGGIEVVSITAGKIQQNTDMREGFIITKVDDTEVYSVDQFLRIMETKRGGVMLEGKYERYPGTRYYAFGLD
jgi:serine protease Do